MADPRAPSGSSSRRGRATDDVVGQFIIGAEIGKGSFAQVYMGRHKVRISKLFIAPNSTSVPFNSLQQRTSSYL